MKSTVYTCNNLLCDSLTKDLKHFKWIEIRSENNTLFVNNNLEDGRSNVLAKYDSIHFCSSKCFTEFFITTT